MGAEGWAGYDRELGSVACGGCADIDQAVPGEGQRAADGGDRALRRPRAASELGQAQREARAGRPGFGPALDILEQALDGLSLTTATATELHVNYPRLLIPWRFPVFLTGIVRG